MLPQPDSLVVVVWEVISGFEVADNHQAHRFNDRYRVVLVTSGVRTLILSCQHWTSSKWNSVSFSVK